MIFSAISSSNWSIRELFWSAVVWMKDFFLLKVWVRSIEGIVNLESEGDFFRVDVIVFIVTACHHHRRMPIPIPMLLR